MADKTPWVELQTLLERDGMTQAQLAEHVGVSFQYINDMIRGHRKAKPAMRRRIAEALKVPQSMLIPGPKNEDGFDGLREEVRDAVREALLEFTGGGEPK